MPVAQDAQAPAEANRVGLLEQPLQLLIEILAAMNQVDNDQLARVVHCIGNSVLRLSFSEVKRVEPVGRSGELFAIPSTKSVRLTVISFWASSDGVMVRGFPASFQSTHGRH